MAVRTAQTLYAKISWLNDRSFPTIFPFNGPNAQELFVTDAAGKPATAVSASFIELFADLSAFLGPGGMIAKVNVTIQDAAGVDQSPNIRLHRDPQVVTSGARPRQGIRQLLFNLAPGGQYVATMMVRLSDGSVAFYAAPFNADGDPLLIGPAADPFVLDDSPLDGSDVLV